MQTHAVLPRAGLDIVTMTTVAVIVEALFLHWAQDATFQVLHVHSSA